MEKKYHSTITLRVSDKVKGQLERERKRMSADQHVEFNLSDVVRRAVLVYLSMGVSKR